MQYTNIQFYANARILHRARFKVRRFAIMDGDVISKPDFQIAVKDKLDIGADNLLILDEPGLENLLAVPSAIKATFPALQKEEAQIEKKLSGKSGTLLKEALNSVLQPVGGYTAENAAAIATHLDPPAKLMTFFRRIVSEHA
jgi:hypothetical protein